MFSEISVPNYNKRLRIKEKTPTNGVLCDLAGVAGFEPTKWRNQNPLPYHLATPQKEWTESYEPPTLITYEAFLVKPANFLLNLDNCPPVSIKR